MSRSSAPLLSTRQAIESLTAGKLVAIPTETVYGLAADAKNLQSIARVFALKGRPADHPLIVHLPSVDALDDWARDVSPLARRLAEVFWPGPLTLVLERAPHVPDAITGGQDSVALRVPAHSLALEVLRAVGPLVAPSANRFGRVSPTRASDVAEELPELDGVLDGGACPVGVESTIVDLRDTPTLLRAGGLDVETLEEVIGAPLARPRHTSPRVPGALASHYAPRARLVAVAPKELENALFAATRWEGRVALVAPRSVVVDVPSTIEVLQVPDDDHGWAEALYRTLRDLDRRGFTRALVVLPEHSSGLYLAVADRLRRAAT